MAIIDEKSAAVHQDYTVSDSNSLDGKNLDEIAIHDLETSGEVVGMTPRTIMAFISMCFAYNAYLFTLLIPAATLSLINADLGPDARYTWITISWNLGGAIFITIGGKMSDIFGRRWFFVGGSIVLVIGSILGATAQSIDQMIATGVLFGVGSGFLETCFSAVQEIVPNKYRGLYTGLVDVSTVVSQIMPLVAWVMIKYTGTWRNMYYVMIGFQSLACAFIFIFYHPPTFETKHAGDGKTKAQLLREFDWFGLFLFTAGCALFIVGVNWGGTVYPWKSAGTLAPIVVGFFTLVGLGIYETHYNITNPILPPHLFRQFRQFTLPIIVVAIVGMQYYSNAVLWPRLSQLLYAKGEIQKGLYAEVLPLGSIIGGIIVAFSKKIGYQRWQVAGAAALQTACVGAMSTASLDNPTKSIFLVLLISICTSVCLLNSFVIIGLGIAHQRDIGTAVGIAGTARLMAGAIATAIFSNVTNNKYGAALGRRVLANIQGLNVPASSIAKLTAAARLNTPAAFKAVPGITPQIQAAAALGNKEAYLEGAHLAFQVALAFGLVATVAAIFIPDIDERKYTDKTVAVQDADFKALQAKKLAGQTPA